MKQDNDNHREDLKQQPDGILVSEIRPNFVKWIIRILLVFWIVMIIIAIPDFVEEYSKITANSPLGPARNTALWELAVKVAGYILILPMLLLFFSPWFVGLNPTAMFMNSQLGNHFSTIVTHVRLRKDKPKKSA